jgi:hypothetical protein
MARLAVSLTIVALTAASAHAEVVVEPGVPFTAPELIAALTIRGAAAHDVVVRAVSPTAVELRTSVGRQRVDIGTAHGPAAARLVALQLTPLAEAITYAPTAHVTARLVPPSHSRWELGISVGGGHGAAALDFGLTEVRADATWVRGPWRWGGSLGWLHGLGKSADPSDPATADFAIARGVAGLAVGPIEIVGGPELIAYRASAASAGVTAGLGGGLRAQFASSARWHMIASADIDAFRHRIVIAHDGVPFAATPRVALTAALGAVWEGP